MNTAAKLSRLVYFEHKHFLQVSIHHSDPRISSMPLLQGNNRSKYDWINCRLYSLNLSVDFTLRLQLIVFIAYRLCDRIYFCAVELIWHLKYMYVYEAHCKFYQQKRLFTAHSTEAKIYDCFTLLLG